MKKILIMLIALTISLVGISTANAQVLTAKDIVDLYKDSSLYTFYRAVYGDLKSNENTLELHINSVKVAEVDLSRRYIEYDKTQDNEYILNMAEIIDGLIDEALGYIDKTKFLFDTSTSTNYAIYEFLGDNSNFDVSNLSDEQKYQLYGYIWTNCETVDNNYSCDYLKISLDTDKRDLYYEKSAIIGDSISSVARTMLLLTPTITIQDLESTSLTVYPKAVSVNLRPEENNCFVYRSTNRDSGYIRINNTRVNCNGEEGVVDSSLEDGKTYYYKTRLTYTNQYSEPIEVTTPKKQNSNTVTTPEEGSVVDETSETENNDTEATREEDNDEKVTSETQKDKNPENPYTGISTHIVASLLVATLGVISVLLLRKKRLFKQI